MQYIHTLTRCKFLHAFSVQLHSFFQKRPALPLYWSGVKAITAVVGLHYWPYWIQEVLQQLFNLSLHSTWIVVICTGKYTSNHLHAASYFTEIIINSRM